MIDLTGKTANELLVQYQKKLEYNDTELAAALGVSVFTIGAWKRPPKNAAFRRCPRSHILFLQLLVATKDTAPCAFPHSEY